MKISNQKREKISEQILAYLFSITPKLVFTSYIAKEIARDEEFTKNLLINLKKKKLVDDVKKNPKGIDYINRTRWKMTDNAYEIYKRNQ